jgi:hypothetical protein
MRVINTESVKNKDEYRGGIGTWHGSVLTYWPEAYHDHVPLTSLGSISQQ